MEEIIAIVNFEIEEELKRESKKEEEEEEEKLSGKVIVKRHGTFVLFRAFLSSTSAYTLRVYPRVYGVDGSFGMFLA